jgi:acyl-CoA synthetase (AMP-forming)/AMP-acid ligase II
MTAAGPVLPGSVSRPRSTRWKRWCGCRPEGACADPAQASAFADPSPGGSPIPPSPLNLAAIHEAIAAAVPDRECLVFRDRRLTWAQVTDRTRRLAHLLRGAGLGSHRDRSELKSWESGQDHVALYLHNGNEYLEGMLGAFKARCAPFNVNYRYVEEELLYLFDNSDARAVIFHARFAPTLAGIRSQLRNVKLWIQVDDGSGESLPGAVDYEEALAAAEPEPPKDLSADDLYILYTGGTTGMPKGVLWRQEEIYRAALSGGAVFDTLEQFADKALASPGARSLPTAPFMHGAAHWGAFSNWHSGGTVLVQSVPERLDPDDVWSTAEREKAQVVLIVGDAFARPLLDQLDRKSYDLSSLFMLVSGGAILTAKLKDEILEKLPHVRIMDALGSSESGTQGAKISTAESKATTGDFDLGPDNLVLSEDLSRVLAPGDPEHGWLARKGHGPLGYYKDQAKTEKTFPVVDGVRYAVPGDRASIGADGRLVLYGRDSVTINSGGEKIFAEEVELALKHHPDVYDAVVCGTPSERWGQQVTALVQLREGVSADEASLVSTCREHIAAYKTPKVFVFVDRMVRAPSGKADYRWARETAGRELGLD